MKTQTLEFLTKLRQRYKAGTQGKIIQALLALTFIRMRCSHVVVRLTEGIDVTFRDPQDRRFALEIKTTGGQLITMTASNVRDLKRAEGDGYTPIIATLRMVVLEGWLFSYVPLTELRPGTMRVEILRAYRQQDWEKIVNSAFDEIVQEHFQGTSADGLSYLNRALMEKGAEVLEDS